MDFDKKYLGIPLKVWIVGVLIIGIVVFLVLFSKNNIIMKKEQLKQLKQQKQLKQLKKNQNKKKQKNHLEIMKII